MIWLGVGFFRKKESAGRNAMTQRDTADRYGTVFINDFGFCGVNQMEFTLYAIFCRNIPAEA